MRPIKIGMDRKTDVGGASGNGGFVNDGDRDRIRLTYVNILTFIDYTFGGLQTGYSISL